VQSSSPVEHKQGRVLVSLHDLKEITSNVAGRLRALLKLCGGSKQDVNNFTQKGA